MSDDQRFYDDSLRMQNWDYSWPGFYFITLVTKNREPILGKIVKKKFIGNTFANILNGYWHQLPYYYNEIHLDAFQIMPDHVHLIIEIKGTDWQEQLSLISKLSKSRTGLPANFNSKNNGIRNSVKTGPINRVFKIYYELDSSVGTVLEPSLQMGPLNQSYPIDILQSEISRQTALQLDQEKLQSRRRMLIPKIVGQYRTVTAKKINILRKTPGKTVWQPHFPDRIIRTLEELERIRQYIRNNPANGSKNCPLNNAAL